MMNSLPRSAARIAIEAAHWKRLATLGGPDWSDRLDRAIEGYLESATTSRETSGGASGLLYGFRVAVQLAEVTNRMSRVEALLGTAEGDAWLVAWDADLADPRMTGDVWRRVGKAQSLLSVALVAGDSAVRTAVERQSAGLPALAAAFAAVDAATGPSALREQLVEWYSNAVGGGRDHRGLRSVVEHVHALALLAALAQRAEVAEWLAGLAAEIEAGSGSPSTAV